MDNLTCNECRTRKLRCSKVRPSCSFCIKHTVQCIYSARTTRTPLTRAYVNSLEKRAKCLEKALLELNPKVDLEATVSGSTVTLSTPESQFTADDSTIRDDRGRGEQTSPEDLEELPQTSSGFDWREGNSPDAKPTDGMATLSVNPHGVGYLGSLAHVALLRVLHRIGWKLDTVIEPIYGPLETSYLQEHSWDATGTLSVQGYVADQFVDAYFDHFHTAYPIIHEATFRAQYSEIIPRPDGGVWPLLFKTVLAIGAWCMDFQIPDGGSQALLNSANMASNSNLLGSGNICVIQALALMSLHLQRQNRPNIAWVYLGAAVRMAMSLGLHKEFPEWKISHHDREVRRRVWWCLYLFDSGESITLGRPILLPSQSTMDVKGFLNVPDTMLTMATLECPAPVKEPTIYSGVSAQVGFHLVFNPIYNRLVSHTEITPSETLIYDAKISEWQSLLPTYLQESVASEYSFHWLRSSRYRLFWRVRSLRMLVFFPTFLRWVGHSKQGDWNNALEDERLSVLRCLDYAHQNISSIKDYYIYEPSSVMGDWYGLYSLFQAGLVSILVIISNLEVLTERYTTLIADLRTIQQVLTAVSARNEQAHKFVGVMNMLIPESLLPNEASDLVFDTTQHEEMIANMSSEFSATQVDEWARFLWPALS